MPRPAMLSAYLADLPHSLESYPACKAKVSVLRSALDVHALDIDPGWPSSIQELVRDPPPKTTWVPEVLSVAAHLAIADASRMDETDVLDWGLRANRHLAESNLYRVLTHLTSPALLLKAASLSWTMIHRGVDIAVETGDGEATISASHPPNVWTELVHQSTAQGFRAVLESSHGEGVDVEIAYLSRTRCDYACTWR